jgi:ketosteroid isomerase-like protein
MRHAITAAVVLGVCSSVFGVPQQRSEKQGGNVEQTVLRIEKELLDAILKGDASASERYMADSYVFIGPDGQVSNKARSIADIKSGDLKLQAATLDDAKVRVYGDTAIVTFSSKDKGTYKGRDLSGETRWTDVFVRQNGRWQLVSGHGSRIAPQ